MPTRREIHHQAAERHQEIDKTHNDFLRNYNGLMPVACEDKSNAIVYSIDLLHGAARSTFSCLTCRKPVTFVVPRSTDRNIKPHFKHPRNRSCIQTPQNKADIDRVHKALHDHEAKRKTEFHQRWQDCFDPAIEVRKFDENRRLFIADVFLDVSDTPHYIRLWDDDEEAGDAPIKQLAIEFQHSDLDPDQILHRETFYRAHDARSGGDGGGARELVWVLDLEPYTHLLEKVTSRNGVDHYHLVLPHRQPQVLRELLQISLRHDKKFPYILLDPGPDADVLFKVVRTPGFMIEKLGVALVDRRDFLHRLHQVHPLRHGWMEETGPVELAYHQDYGELMRAREGDKLQKLMLLIENVTYGNLKERFRRYCQTSAADFLEREHQVRPTTVDELICMWFSVLTRRDARAYDLFVYWFRYQSMYILQYLAPFVRHGIREDDVDDEDMKNVFYASYAQDDQEFLCDLLDAWYDEYVQNVSDVTRQEEFDDERYHASWTARCEALTQKHRALQQEARDRRDCAYARDMLTHHAPYLRQHGIVSEKDDPKKPIRIIALLELLDKVETRDLFSFCSSGDRKGSCLAYHVMALLGEIHRGSRALFRIFFDILRTKREAFFREYPLRARCGAARGKPVNDETIPDERADLWEYLEQTPIPFSPLMRDTYDAIRLFYQGNLQSFYEYYMGIRQPEALPYPYETDDVDQKIQELFAIYTGGENKRSQVWNGANLNSS